MKKNSFNQSYLLIFLLVPIVVIVYLYMKLGKKSASFESYDFDTDMENQADEYSSQKEPVVKSIAPNGLNDRQMGIIEYMRENKGNGRVSEMVAKFAQTDRTLRRDLNKLEGLGIVKRSGSTKSVSYTLA